LAGEFGVLQPNIERYEINRRMLLRDGRRDRRNFLHGSILHQRARAPKRERVSNHDHKADDDAIDLGMPIRMRSMVPARIISATIDRIREGQPDVPSYEFKNSAA
jgi:hypothetical protein